MSYCITITFGFSPIAKSMTIKYLTVRQQTTSTLCIIIYYGIPWRQAVRCFQCPQQSWNMHQKSIRSQLGNYITIAFNISQICQLTVLPTCSMHNLTAILWCIWLVKKNNYHTHPKLPYHRQQGIQV